MLPARKVAEVASLGETVFVVADVIVVVVRCCCLLFARKVAVVIEVASVINLSEASDRVAAGLFMN